MGSFFLDDVALWGKLILGKEGGENGEKWGGSGDAHVGYRRQKQGCLEKRQRKRGGRRGETVTIKKRAGEKNERGECATRGQPSSEKTEGKKKPRSFHRNQSNEAGRALRKKVRIRKCEGSIIGTMKKKGRGGGETADHQRENRVAPRRVKLMLAE